MNHAYFIPQGAFVPQPMMPQQQQFAHMQMMPPPPQFGQPGMMLPFQHQSFHAPPPQPYYAPQQIAPQAHQQQIQPPPQPMPQPPVRPVDPQSQQKAPQPAAPPPKPQPLQEIVKAGPPKNSLPGKGGIVRVPSGGSFVANPTTKSLGAGQGLLSEAFGVVAHRFAAFDLDNAKVITFHTIAFQLSLRGFTDRDNLVKAFKEIGVDENRSVHFDDFLAMIHVWSVDALPSVFFKQEKNAQVVSDAAIKLEEIWKRFDADMSRTISYEELTQMMKKEFPEIWRTCQPVIELFYPVAERDAGQKLKFATFIHMLYACLCKLPANRLLSSYALPSIIHPSRRVAPTTEDKGRMSEQWSLYNSAFAQLEKDFKSFDRSGDDFVDVAEITQATHFKPGIERLGIHRRLQQKLEQVDPDEKQSLDFFEFSVMAYLMCLDGSYTDLVPTCPAADASCVKLALAQLHDILLELHHANKAPLDMLITMGDGCKFFRRVIGFEPPEIDAVFKEVRGATMTLGQLIQLIYWIMRPNMGCYNSFFYRGKSEANLRPTIVPTEIEDGGEQQPEVMSIDPIDASMITRSKPLGSGSQGSVWLGTYGSQPVAIKSIKGGPTLTHDALAAVKREVDIQYQLQHPNCHMLFGSSVAAGTDALLVSEVCVEGSVFEVYLEKRCVFAEATAWRLALEVALGMEFVHGLGCMHRDLKSLNILLASGFTAKVSDFSQATAAAKASTPAGTLMWMAPEVMANLNPNTKRVEYDRRCDVFSYAMLVYEIYNCKVRLRIKHTKPNATRKP